jgi:hypothetical protein
MKIAFLPVSILGGLLAGILGEKIFERLWGLVDDEEPPDAKHREVGMAKLAIALIIEGAVFRLVRGLFDHGSRRAFARLTGTWPGEQTPDKA